MKNWWRRSSSLRSPEAAGRSPAPGSARSLGAGGAARPTGVVDAHVHVFPPELIRERATYLARDPWFATLYGSPEARMVTADEAVAHMDETGVALSVIFGFAFADQGLCRMVNDYVLDAVRFHPARLVGLACVSPAAAGAEAELVRCLDGGMRGCGELAPDGQDLVEAGTGGLVALAGCLRERGLPLLVHANEPVGHQYPGKGRFTPAACFALAHALPGTTIVFAHLGGGLFVYETMPEVRKILADVFYDTAAVPYLYGPEVYKVAIASAGPEKLIFGSDFPLLSPARYREGLDVLEPAQRLAVEAGNARRVFGL
jgi:predicted TIM-barrel fold metal-dependent hydrolase